MRTVETILFLTAFVAGLCAAGYGVIALNRRQERALQEQKDLAIGLPEHLRPAEVMAAPWRIFWVAVAIVALFAGREIGGQGFALGLAAVVFIPAYVVFYRRREQQQRSAIEMALSEVERRDTVGRRELVEQMEAAYGKPEMKGLRDRVVL